MLGIDDAVPQAGVRAVVVSLRCSVPARPQALSTGAHRFGRRSVRPGSIRRVTIAADRSRAHALVDEICGSPDATADRAVQVLNAHAAALAWVYATTGSYPAPDDVAARLDEASAALRARPESGDPAVVLAQAAADALADHRAASIA